ncbi:hypothetical protein [Streptomyces sp. CB01881]|uniref:hypothetical protein n=1 Tax=Streptomyces sp. CB01881 TaxID=2078691 RepID=UPI000CDBDCA9|nr:hypothetical protein [Streptomyces sp. CB01881]AUY53040.1 hypothetical protein C2142_33635 [Streptomyces sp. CB01881]TYC70755.1 hypothetical protein EH183_33695 [Streptomyces sp. CB01881]
MSESQILVAVEAPPGAGEQDAGPDGGPAAGPVRRRNRPDGPGVRPVPGDRPSSSEQLRGRAAHCRIAMQYLD